MANTSTSRSSIGRKSRFHHSHRPQKTAKVTEWEEKDPAKVPTTVQGALREALRIENVSLLEYDDFLWIMAQESSGVVGVRNPSSTARGLFQL
jgi:hypothetical protein